MHVSSLGQIEDLGRINDGFGGGGGVFPIPANNGVTRDHFFKRASTMVGGMQRVGAERQVADFSGASVHSRPQLAVQDEADPYACSDRDECKTVVLGADAFVQFPERGDVDVVFQHHLMPEYGLQVGYKAEFLKVAKMRCTTKSSRISVGDARSSDRCRYDSGGVVAHGCRQARDESRQLRDEITPSCGGGRFDYFTQHAAIEPRDTASDFGST